MFQTRLSLLRNVLSEEDETQPNGKVFKKLILGDYDWLSYKQIQNEVNKFGRGLRLLGVEPGDRIAIYAETRAEWMIACLGAFTQNIHVATVYTNLGDQGVLHALKETKVSCIVTSHELLPRFKMLLEELPDATHLIYMEDQAGHMTQTAEYRSDVKIVPFKNVTESGVNPLPENMAMGEASPSDNAIIMYTSGSTGVPKGVVLTHANLIACMKCLMFMLVPVDELYIAYLPLAHVLELMSENTMMLFGIRVGYSSPNTMTDNSTKVKKGCRGDASVLKPTYMCAVPLIMDRIYKNIREQVAKKGPTFEKIFNFCYQYKLQAVKAGKTTPVLDLLVFRKLKAVIGGRIKLILVGGAPLAPETHDFIRVCLGCIVIQGYSLTETCCTGTVMKMGDLTTGRVGEPMTGMEVKLIPWNEGNYKVTDKPNARGEIVISGQSVAKCYFKENEKTKYDFFEDDGKRWFKTGDIGEYDKNGSLKIIDRKKDLVKLQQGEYVSLGKVEAELKTHPLVENICVYGDGYQQYTVAILVPNQQRIEDLGQRMGKTEKSFEQLCVDHEVVREVQKLIAQHGRERKLHRFEIPHLITLVTEQWTPESGLITAAFKIKRKEVQGFYEKSIKRMYESKRA